MPCLQLKLFTIQEMLETVGKIEEKDWGGTEFVLLLQIYYIVNLIAAVKCEELPTLPFNTRIASNISIVIPALFNTSLTVMCKDGYLLYSNTEYRQNLTCQSDHTWSPEVTECQRESLNVNALP